MPSVKSEPVATARIPVVAVRTIIKMLVIIAAAHGLTATVAASDPEAEFEAPWIGTSLAYVVPTAAEIVGGGFQPYQSLWLELTDPLGSEYTTAIATDGQGRIAVAVPANQPGVHYVRVRDGDGLILSEDEIFFAAD